MTSTPTPPPLDGPALTAQVTAALQQNAAQVADTVRSLTLQALQGGGLDKTAVQSVVNAVLQGAQRHTSAQTEATAQALRDTVRGLDEALATAAQATQLAIREATGRGHAFSETTLQRASQDLATLESLLVDTLNQSAQQTTGFTQSTLRDLAAHAKTSGTAVGKMVQAALAPLGQAVVDAAQQQVQMGTDMLRQEAALFAAMAAGMLEGVAERLRAFPSAKPTEAPKDD